MKNQELIALNYLNDLKKLGIVYLASIIVVQILFYKEFFINTLRLTTGFFWLFVLPGFSIMLNYEKKFDFIERLIIGTALGFAIVGTIGYSLGLLGISMKLHQYLIPIATIAIGLYLTARNKH